VGTRTDAALAEVVAARTEFAEEVDRLEAAGRAAIDIPAKVRRSPAKAAGVAGGAAFVVLGGPRRLFRRARRIVTGRDEPALPKSMLPKEVDTALAKLGTDGAKVRGTIEREFAKYLDERAKERRKEGIVAAGVALATNALRPVTIRAGRQLVERAFNPDGPSFEEQLERLKARRRTGGEGEATDGGPKSGAGL
jgi:hypothetical protein